MTYQQAVKYLESFINYEKIPAYPYKQSLKLERIKDFLQGIGNPQDVLKCVHVAGSKGKGSTCVFIAYILRNAGFKVGLYTSPHLVDFRERIRILDHRPQTTDHRPEFEGMIAQKGLTDLVVRLKPAIKRYNQKSKYGPLSFFEVYTALAFMYFQEKKVDYVVLETGLGGRLDATNVVNPLVCAITPISYEHTQKLGHSLTAIAREKAGIIKKQRLAVISAPQVKEARQVIRAKCRQVQARLYTVGKDITYQKNSRGFQVKGILHRYRDLDIRLAGEYQLSNASVAIGVIEALIASGMNISSRAIRDGLDHALWPGRCEVIARQPLIILDGAQNLASAQALKETVSKGFPYRKLILILGISSDKDIRGVCGELGDLADQVILTKANNPRAAKPEFLAQYFPGKKVYLSNSVLEAKKIAQGLCAREDLILVTGSLFVVGEFRNDYR